MDRAHAPLVLLSVALLACGGPAEAPAEDALAGEPVAAEAPVATPPEAGPAETTLWVWHGATDLRGLHQATEGHVGVAYLARTLRVRRDGVYTRPRRSPLYLDAQTRRTAVVRIEVEPEVSADELAIAPLVGAIDPVLSERASALQIDFDARRSMRPFYARLLRALKERLPDGWSLEMTALGSWCLQDRWLADVPVDRVVPMLFGPGHERALTFAALRRGPLPEPRCRASHGVEEGQRSPRPPERLYVFPDGGPWTLERALASVPAHRSWSASSAGAGKATEPSV